MSSDLADVRATPPASCQSRDLTPSLGEECGTSSCGPGGGGGGPGEEGGECGDDDDEGGYAESPFEGESSITAHTVFASEFLHHAVGRTSLDSSLDPSMHSALTSLQQIVHMQRRTSTMADIRFPNQKPLPKGGLKDLPMPPLRVVVGILRELKANAASRSSCPCPPPEPQAGGGGGPLSSSSSSSSYCRGGGGGGVFSSSNCSPCCPSDTIRLSNHLSLPLSTKSPSSRGGGVVDPYHHHFPPPPAAAAAANNKRREGLTRANHPLTLLPEFTPLSFTLMCSFIGVEEFTEHCRRVYFATEDYSQASFIITVAGLFYILQERACTEQERDPALAADYQRYEAMCRDSLETVLAHFSLIQPAKRENIEALLLGSSYAVEIAKPSLAWQLNCAASQLCLTMGYHRALPPPSESQELPQSSRGSLGGSGGNNNNSSSTGISNRDAYEQSKRLVLFWFTYTLDKGLALRLGRPSVIRDYDITVPWQVGPIRDWDEYRDTLNVWIRHARVQGRMYDELYSPAALQRPMDARVRTVVELVAELRELRVLVPVLRAEDKKPPRDPSKPYEPTLIEILTKSDEVSFLSSIALCYRAIPPGVPVPAGPGDRVSAHGRSVSSTFSFECIDAARESMAAHQGCMQMMTGGKDMAAAYVHWYVVLDVRHASFFIFLTQNLLFFSLGPSCMLLSSPSSSSSATSSRRPTWRIWPGCTASRPGSRAWARCRSPSASCTGSATRSLTWPTCTSRPRRRQRRRGRRWASAGQAARWWAAEVGHLRRTRPCTRSAWSLTCTCATWASCQGPTACRRPLPKWPGR